MDSVTASLRLSQICRRLSQSSISPWKPNKSGLGRNWQEFGADFLEKSVGLMPLSAHEFDRLIRKFGFQTRGSGDLLAWLEVEGKIVVRTRRSNKSGDLPMHHSIRQQMRLSDDQLRKAIKCTLDRDSYIEVLREKGLLG